MNPLGATLEGTINIEETKLNNAEDPTFLAASKKWLDHIKDGIRQAENMYGVKISVDWRYKENDPTYDADSEPGDVINNRPV